MKQNAVWPNGYAFTRDWFSQHLTVWEKLQFSMDGPSRILEIGSYEGRVATWLIETKLKPGDELYIVDTWEWEFAEKNSEVSFEDRFDQNIKTAQERVPGITLLKRKGKSRVILPQLLSQGMQDSFDFIYVDGWHDACSVLEDLIFANMLCKVGGLIFCDDYLWQYNDLPLTQTPKLAIDSFTNCFREKVEIVRDIPLFQICLRKFKS